MMFFPLTNVQFEQLENSSVENRTSQPLVQPQTAPASGVPIGPPLPAEGLPPGWTMEQWNNYGEQWLSGHFGQ